MSAAQIARSYFLEQYRHAWILRFHSRPELAGLLHEAPMAIGDDGCVLAVNEAALKQRGKGDRSLLAGRDISQVMQLHFGHSGAARTQRRQHAVVDPLRLPRAPFLRPGAAAATRPLAARTRPVPTAARLPTPAHTWAPIRACATTWTTR